MYTRYGKLLLKYMRSNVGKSNDAVRMRTFIQVMLNLDDRKGHNLNKREGCIYSRIKTVVTYTKTIETICTHDSL